MEIKRIFLAGFLIMLVWVVWTALFPPLEPEPGEPLQEKKEVASDSEQKEPILKKEGELLDVPSKEFEIITPLFSARLSNAAGGTFLQYTLSGEKYKGAYTKQSSNFSWESKKHSYDESAPVSFLFTEEEGFVSCNPCLEGVETNNLHSILVNDQPLPENGGPLNIETTTTIKFISQNNDFNHLIIIEPDSYRVRHQYELLSEKLKKEAPLLVWKNGTRPSEKYGWLDDQNSYGMFVSKNGEDSDYLTGNNETDPLSFKDIEWVGSRNKFFVSAIIPVESNVKSGKVVPVQNLSFSGSEDSFFKNRGTKASVYDIFLTFENSSTFEFDSFLAPLEYSLIKDSDIKDLDDIMTMGGSILRPISKFVLNIIIFINSYLPFGGYALVLIIFAFIVRIVAGPLTKRSLQSTKKMQEVQPLIKEIQEKYKSDPKKMQMKIMETYKNQKVNPLSGCFLMFLQWPIMIPPFILFRSIIELRGEPLFLWIQDLSLPDYIFELPFHIPLIGIGNGYTGVGLLPILMGVTLFLTMKQSSGDMPQQNKVMLYTMNGMFVLLFNSFPAGLNLYYVVYNLLNYFQQRRTSQNKDGQNFSQKPPFWTKLVKKK